MDTPWEEAVSYWLNARDWLWLASWWPFIWMNIPQWVTAAVTGAAFGLFRPRRFWPGAWALGAGFVLLPHLYMLASGMHPCMGMFLMGAASYCVKMAVLNLASVIALLVAAYATYRLRGGPRIGPFECRGCGYDLHGSVAAGSETCPECGREIDGEVMRAES